MMMRSIRRHQRRIAAALLLLNVSGARAISVSCPCGNARVFYSASLGFKAIQKAALCQEWKAPPPLRSLGEDRPRFSADDLATVGRVSKVAAVNVIAASSSALDDGARRMIPLRSTDNLKGASPGVKKLLQFNI